MGLILIPAEVTERAEAVRTLLAETVTGYRGVLQVIQNFANNDELDTDSWNTFKAKALDYHQTIAQGIVAAEDGILEDAAALEQSVGTEELYEDTLKETIKKLEDEKQQCQDEIQRLQNLRKNIIVGLCDIVCAMISQAIMQLKEQIDLIDQVLKVCREKLQFLYNAENNTQRLFIQSVQLLIAVEAAINDAGVEITGAGERSDGNWKIKISDAYAEMGKKIETFIEEALRTELQIDLSELKELYGEKVVNCFTEIVMESGINRLESGSSVKFVETAICSITGYQVRKVDGKYEYVDKNGIRKEFKLSILEKQLEVDRYVDLSYDVAQWYVANVDKYCQMTKADILANGGKPSTAGGRCYYKCDLPGDLNGINVSDDCSGYVWATLVQAGYFDRDTAIYTSSAYLPGGNAEKKMEEAGFTWHPMSELKGEDLKTGDILVRNGHVEIFYDYNGDAQERALTWGNVYNELPARKDAYRKNINQKYEGIWRLE